MIYVDTSALVALIVKESGSGAVAAWYETSRSELVSAAWCVAEFGSAIGLKQRTGQLDAGQAQAAWEWFDRLVTSDLRLLPVENMDFRRAAMLTLSASNGIRAGDALHLACAERVGAKGIATLDTVMADNARRLRLKPVALRG
jgi:predicted nucleic acid-binding protein